VRFHFARIEVCALRRRGTPADPCGMLRRASCSQPFDLSILSEDRTTHKRTKVCSAAPPHWAVPRASPARPLSARPPSSASRSRARRSAASKPRRALPVQVIKKEQIEKSGATSVTDLLQKLAVVQGSFGESGGVGGTAASPRCRSRNARRHPHLVLSNGHRLTQRGGQPTGFGAAIDLNSLPISAIERVEILTDGASALYGAMRIAGAVNFITRRYTDEGDVTLGMSKPRGGADEKRISVTKGFGNIEQDGFNVMLSLQHDERTKPPRQGPQLRKVRQGLLQLRWPAPPLPAVLG